MLKPNFMKNTIKILILLLSLNCFAQYPVRDISEMTGTIDIPGIYYQDTQSLLNPFVGTYVYNQNGKMLKIELRKKEQSFWYNYYEDLVIGGYQYIENGVEKINTLNSLNTFQQNGRLYSISGNFLLNYNRFCDDCQVGEKHLYIGLVEKSTSNSATIDFKVTRVNGQPALRVWLYWRLRTRVEGQPQQPHASFPQGEYIMLKQ
jgi:hypothetical protein